MKLNPEQIEAIGTREGAWCCMATAGSGKTTTLVERVRALFKEGATQDDVLALTFTKEAADNLEKRLGLKIAKTNRGGFRTFHSFCLNLIKNEARFLPYGLSSEPFPAGNGLSKILLDAMKQHGIKRKEFEAVRAYISKKKRMRWTPEQCLARLEFYENEFYARAYSTYESRLRDGGMLDFDSMIVEAVNMLEKYPEVKDSWQFKWVLCDEGQDTDDLQFRLLQLVSNRYKNIYVVGDFCQALYEFRGASPSNLLEFERWFPDSKTIILPENFRSTPEIVEFSKQNAPIRNELTDNIRTANPAGGRVEFRMYSGPDQEAEAVLSEALKDPGNSAILARTNNQLGLYETLCLQHSIRFHLLGRSGLWNKSEITTLVHLTAFCMGNTQPSKYSETLLYMHRPEIRRLDAHAALRKIVSYASLENLYSNEDYDEDENFALTNIRTVVDIAKRFKTLGDFLNHARRAAHASRKSKNAVTLGTIHQAKGLEWKNVFVIGCQEKLMPHEKGDAAEEARIWYVAITRAAHFLRISFAGTPSRFIEPFLTPEIKAELNRHSARVEKIQKQLSMFEGPA